jgi:hypothetical protein
MLLGKLNDGVQLLKAVGTVVDNRRPIGYQLEPSTIYRDCVYIWISFNNGTEASVDTSAENTPLKAHVRTILIPAADILPRVKSISSSEFNAGNQ